MKKIVEENKDNILNLVIVNRMTVHQTYGGGDLQKRLNVIVIHR